MPSILRARYSASLALAILMSLALAGQAFGATWATPAPLGTGDFSEGGGLATTGPSSAVAVVLQDGVVNVRRSSNSGVTWGPLVPVGSGWGSAIAAYGSDVDLVWHDGAAMHYARSTDGGASFISPSTVLAQGVYFPAVAHGPNGVVAVAWMGGTGLDRVVKVRVSTNDGASFGAAKTIASGFVGSPAVAVGQGVIYVGYTDSVGLRVRRSTNAGATFGTAKTVATDAYGDPIHRLSMTAVESKAYIGYSAVPLGGGPNGLWARYARTTDKGSTWAAPRNLSPKPTSSSGRDSYDPLLSLQGGVIRAVFERCLDNDCATRAVFYRQSSNSTTWTTAYRASPASHGDSEAAGVGCAGKTIVLYTGDAYGDAMAYVRLRTP